jgi:hypothetical protein
MGSTRWWATCCPRIATTSMCALPTAKRCETSVPPPPPCSLQVVALSLSLPLSVSHADTPTMAPVQSDRRTTRLRPSLTPSHCAGGSRSAWREHRSAIHWPAQRQASSPHEKPLTIEIHTCIKALLFEKTLSCYGDDNQVSSKSRGDRAAFKSCIKLVSREGCNETMRQYACLSTEHKLAFVDKPRAVATVGINRRTLVEPRGQRQSGSQATAGGR